MKLIKNILELFKLLLLNVGVDMKKGLLVASLCELRIL